MIPVPEANGVLADAEKALRDLMQRELRAQRYPEVAELAGLADAIARLARDGSPLNPASPSPAIHRKTEIAKNNRKASSKPRGTKNRKYPRFERDDDKLVKIGWSKKAREEYEHRAPRSAVLAFTQHIGETIPKRKSFLVEEVLPVHDVTGEELPSYQVYLALAWLRQVGAVEKKGRDGYVRVADPLDGSEFDTMWNQIPERS